LRRLVSLNVKIEKERAQAIEGNSASPMASEDSEFVGSL